MKPPSKNTSLWAAGVVAGAALTIVQQTHAQTYYAIDSDLPNGNLGSVAISPPSTITLSTAQGVTYNNAGDIAVSYYGGTINIYSPNGLYLSTFANLGSGNGGLVYDSSGDLFVSHANSVLEYGPTGNFISTFVSVNGANGLAFDSAGDLYAASGNNNAVYEYDSSGNLLHTYTAGDMNGAFGVAFTQTGNLLVSSFNGSVIDEFSTSGSYLGDFATGLSGPAGIAADGAGDIYEVDRNTQTINELNSSGTIVNSYSTPSILPTYVAVQPAPEPSMIAMAGVGGLALLGLRFRRK